MTLIFMDGFDHYGQYDITKKWTSVSSLMSIDPTGGRRGTQALLVDDYSEFATIQFGTQLPQWYAGFAFRPLQLPPSAPAQIMRFMNVTTVQTTLGFNPNGSLSVFRGSPSTNLLGTSAPGMLPIGGYSYVEWMVNVHNTTGSTSVRVNGVEVLNLTNVNTSGNGSAYADTFSIGNPGSSSSNIGQATIDDCYVCDALGPAPHNTFLGDVRVDTLYPNADGTFQQWTTPLPGPHYTLVDEKILDQTDYVASLTPGHRETYAIQDLTVETGTIYAVQLNLAAVKNDSNARQLKALYLSGASEALGPAMPLSAALAYKMHIQTTDPATGAAWTAAAINGMQCGAEVA